MKIVSRADWGAKPPKSRRAIRENEVTHFFLHHAAGTYKDGPSAMRAIQKFHQDSRGWADYAYNFGVWDDGNIYEGRGFGAQGGHTRGWNTRSVAVCYMGDGSKPVPKPALEAIAEVARMADEYFGRNLIRQGHKDVGATACPGDWLYEWWQEGSRRAPVVEDAPQRPSVRVREEMPKPKGAATPDVRDGWRRHLARMRRPRPR